VRKRSAEVPATPTRSASPARGGEPREVDRFVGDQGLGDDGLMRMRGLSEARGLEHRLDRLQEVAAAPCRARRIASLEQNAAAGRFFQPEHQLCVWSCRNRIRHHARFGASMVKESRRRADHAAIAAKDAAPRREMLAETGGLRTAVMPRCSSHPGIALHRVPPASSAAVRPSSTATPAAPRRAAGKMPIGQRARKRSGNRGEIGRLAIDGGRCSRFFFSVSIFPRIDRAALDRMGWGLRNRDTGPCSTTHGIHNGELGRHILATDAEIWVMKTAQAVLALQVAHRLR